MKLCITCNIINELILMIAFMTSDSPAERMKIESKSIKKPLWLPNLDKGVSQDRYVSHHILFHLGFYDYFFDYFCDYFVAYSF